METARFPTHARAPALAAAGVALGCANGLHALRHWYASVGAAFALATCTHLMSAREQRGRKAVGRALRGPATADGAGTDRASGEAPE